MKKAHCGPTSQKKPVGGPNLTNIPAQTQFPPQRLPANEIRVPYQSSAPSGQEVVQCCGFGAWLREKLCCGGEQTSDSAPASSPHTVEDEHDNGSEPISIVLSLGDGPCAIAALRRLRWNTEESTGKRIVQTVAFAKLGHEVDRADMLLHLGRVMILFLRSENEEPFHVMYTDGTGNLCGDNNNMSVLMKKFGMTLDDCFEKIKDGVLTIPIQSIVWNADDGTILKYITFEEYQNAVRPKGPEGGAGE